MLAYSSATAILSISLLSIFGSSNPAERDGVQMNAVVAEDLTETEIDIDCSFDRFVTLIDAANASNRKSFDQNLQMSVLPVGDPDQRFTRLADLHSLLAEGDNEAVAYLTESSGTVVVAQLPRPLDFQISIENLNQCKDLTGESCRPLLFFDGADAFCLFIPADQFLNDRRP